MRVLVTGSSGFIGHHLAQELARQGAQVTGWDIRPPRPGSAGVQHRTVDLLDAPVAKQALVELAPEAIVHLAARTDLQGRTLDEYPANTIGVEHLLDAIRGCPSVRRVICTSSQLVCRIDYRPANEHDYAPSTPYGESKVRTEQIWREADGAGTVWCLVRPTTIWGPGMNPHYLRFFRMIRDGRYFHVGRGPTYKSYGYVGNTVYQYVRLLEAPEASIARRTLFLADYEPISLEGWAEAFRSALDAPPIRTIPPVVARAAARTGDVLNLVGFTGFPFNSFRLRNVLTAYQVNVDATREVCGELPYTMTDGVKATARWLRSVWAPPTQAHVAGYLDSPRAGGDL
jgi:nucleoside-diphosphate-sugar epimerase